MKQETFTDIEYSFRKKKTEREKFWEIMDEIIPWDEWQALLSLITPSEDVAVHPWTLKRC